MKFKDSSGTEWRRVCCGECGVFYALTIEHIAAMSEANEGRESDQWSSACCPNGHKEYWSNDDDDDDEEEEEDEPEPDPSVKIPKYLPADIQ